MKLIKKIGIGFLALIICVCSCFKFVNAEMLDEPFTLEFEKTYLFVIRNDYAPEVGILIASAPIEDGYITITLDNEELVFEIDINGTVTTSYAPLTFIKQENNFTYYSFVYNIATNSYVYEDIEISYFEIYGNDNFSVYNSIYGLIENYLFGGDIPTNSYQELTATLLSGIICIFVFALPFLIVWKTIRIIMG